MHADEIKQLYEAEVIAEIAEKCIIIKINQGSIDYRNGDIYEATRYAWKLRMDRAKNADYVFAVLNGLVVAIYTGMQWSYEGSRLKFNAIPAPDEVSQRYVRKRTPEKYRQKGNASPCQYVNC